MKIDRGLVRADFQEAKKLAVQIFGMSTAIFPSSWRPEVSSQIIDLVTKFSIHARRLTEALDLKNTILSSRDIRLGTAHLRSLPELGISAGDVIECEPSFTVAVNKVVHAATLVPLWTQVPKEEQKYFEQSVDVYNLSVLKVAAQPRENQKIMERPIWISLPGFANAFLFDIVTEVKENALWAAVDGADVTVTKVNGNWHLHGGPIS